MWFKFFLNLSIKLQLEVQLKDFQNNFIQQEAQTCITTTAQTGLSRLPYLKNSNKPTIYCIKGSVIEL